MAFDTVVLNDGTSVRPLLAHLSFRFLSGAYSSQLSRSEPVPNGKEQ